MDKLTITGESLEEDVQFSSVLFVESPAGVGFSYATDGNLVSDDDSTAKESYEALKSFFKVVSFRIVGEFVKLHSAFCWVVSAFSQLKSRWKPKFATIVKNHSVPIFPKENTIQNDL